MPVLLRSVAVALCWLVVFPSAVTSSAVTPSVGLASDADRRAAAALSAGIDSARTQAGHTRLASHATLDQIAHEEAASVACAGDGSGQRGLGAMIRRLRQSDFVPATWTAGVWLRAVPAGVLSAEVLQGETDRDEIPQVLAAWRRAQPRWFGDVIDGDWSHIGVAVARTRRATAYAMIVARDRDVDLERTLARFEDVAGVQAALRAASDRARVARGLSKLTPDARLDDAATRYARDMMARGFFAHRDPDGATATERVRATGFAIRHSVAENLAKGVFTPEEVIERWLASDGHRRNLLRPGRWSLGVGIASRLHSDEVEVIWVQVFAR